MEKMLSYENVKKTWHIIWC